MRRTLIWIAAAAGMGLTLWLGIWPWSGYVGCGTSRPATLPDSVRIGLYEEFPTPARLLKLRQVDFPVRLAVAATSREEFTRLKATLQQEYPQVQEVVFWPLLSLDEGYYPGTWSKGEAIKRIAREANGVSVLWDLEWPRHGRWFPTDWPDNRTYLDEWFSRRKEPSHIWRAHSFLGLDSRFLTLAGMHFDPRDYPAVFLHLDLYTAGDGLPDPLLDRIMRCGVEQYGERFIPSLGVLNDYEGAPEQFIPTATLSRYLAAARRAGVSEVWLFGANGLNEDYLGVIHESLPVEPLSQP